MSFKTKNFAGIGDFFNRLDPREPSEPVRPFPSLPQPF